MSHILPGSADGEMKAESAKGATQVRNIFSNFQSCESSLAQHQSLLLERTGPNGFYCFGTIILDTAKCRHMLASERARFHLAQIPSRRLPFSKA